LALAASSSRFFGGSFVANAPRRLIDIAATFTAARNRASLAFDGLLNGDLAHVLRSPPESLPQSPMIEVKQRFDVPAHAV
jgi:hypothetical protein